MKTIQHFGFTGLFVLTMLCAYSASAQAPQCGNITGGVASFDPGSCRLSSGAQQTLNGLAEQMRGEPACRVVVMGNAGGNKRSQQLSWARIYAVIEYMSDSKNIDRGRFVFAYDQSASENGIVLRAAEPGDDRPNSAPEPFSSAAPCR